MSFNPLVFQGLVHPKDVHTVSKGWGYERWIVNNELYCGKELFFFAGKQCSFHFHKKKTETFFVAEGTVSVQTLAPPSGGYQFWFECPDFRSEDELMRFVKKYSFGTETRILSQGSVFHIPPGLIHSVLGMTDAKIFEFSTEHFDDDSYRIINGD